MYVHGMCELVHMSDHSIQIVCTTECTGVVFC